jgi:pyridoxal/pyridoxine/pyridoxamine kinase
MLFIITPNEIEAELLTGIKVTDAHHGEKCAGKLRDRGPRTLLYNGSGPALTCLTDNISRVIR